MSEIAVIVLQIFTACLFAAYACFAMWWTDRKAETRGHNEGHRIGKRLGIAEGEVSGYAAGEGLGREYGRKEGYVLGFKDAQPVRGERGRFKRRAQ
jgi:hypothetical protein